MEHERAKLTFEFLIQNPIGTFFVEYYVELARGEERIYAAVEQLSYRENTPESTSKILVKKGKELQICTQSLEDLSEKHRITAMVTSHLSEKENTSFIFHKELKPMLQDLLAEAEYELIENIVMDFNRDLHVITNRSIGMVMAKYIMPFNVYLDQSRGMIPYDLSAPALLPESLYQTLVDVINQTNEVLSTIIPDLKIDIQKITEQMLDNGERGVQFEFLSNRCRKDIATTNRIGRDFKNYLHLKCINCCL